MTALSPLKKKLKKVGQKFVDRSQNVVSLQRDSEGLEQQSPRANGANARSESGKHWE